MSATTHLVSLSTNECPISEITVYQDQAQIHRKLTCLQLDLSRAIHIEVHGIASSIDNDSIRIAFPSVTGINQLRLVDVQLRDSNAQSDPSLLTQLEREVLEKRKELESLNEEVEKNQIQVKGIESKQEWIKAYAQNIASSATPLITSASEVPATTFPHVTAHLNTFVDQYGQRSVDLATEKALFLRKIEAAQSKINDLTSIIDSLTLSPGYYKGKYKTLHIFLVPTQEPSPTFSYEVQKLDLTLDIYYRK
jgi:hypothetical protein